MVERSRLERRPSAEERRRGWGVEHCALLVLGLCPVLMFMSQRGLHIQEHHPLLGDALRRFREADSLGFVQPFEARGVADAAGEGGADHSLEALLAAADVDILARAAALEEQEKRRHGGPAPESRHGGLPERKKAELEAAELARGLPPMYDDGSGASIVLGEDRCAAFRAASTDRRRCVAGLFNTGTNLMWKLLRNNCLMPKQCPGFKYGKYVRNDLETIMQSELLRNKGSTSCAPFLYQAPWGKHNPLHWRGEHSAVLMDLVNVSEVLPVMVVKDPLTWSKSMCKMGYAVIFRHNHCQCCPSPLSTTQSTVAWRKEFNAYNYRSLVHLWSEWNAEYLESLLPRLIVRYEDLLWRPRETTKRVCDCVGGRMRDDFIEIEDSAKHGPGHGYSSGTADEYAAKYGNETKRYEGLMDYDTDFLNANIDHRLVDHFHYQASTARQRHFFPNVSKCIPTREKYLESMKLKIGPTGGAIPLDDESDGVIAAGRFYPNPKKPNSRFGQRLAAQHKQEAAFIARARAEADEVRRLRVAQGAID